MTLPDHNLLLLRAKRAEGEFVRDLLRTYLVERTALERNRHRIALPARPPKPGWLPRLWRSLNFALRRWQFH